MDVEYNSELSDTEYEEINNSDMIRPYMYEPIRRERDEDSEDEDVNNSLPFHDHEFGDLVPHISTC